MLLQLATTDPFPSQKTTKNCPGPVIIGDNKEYKVKAITNKCWHHIQGRQYQVKWTGWSRRTWEREAALEDATALDVWRQHHPPIEPPDTAGRGE